MTNITPFEEGKVKFFEKALRKFIIQKDSKAREASAKSGMPLDIKITEIYDMGQIRFFPLLKLFTSDVSFDAQSKDKEYSEHCRAIVATDRDDYSELYVRRVTNLRYFGIV